MKFIPRTIFPGYNIPLSNFKGHHQKALTKFGHLAPQIDLVLEVRDSRAPISTTNVLFDKVLAKKKKIILYSKKDLSVLKREMLDKWHKSKGEDYMFIDCRDKKDARKIIGTVSDYYDMLIPPPPLGMRLMIIGMPNVGKSTLVNNLRATGYADKMNSISNASRKVARTGGQPGVTKNTSEVIRISKDPDVLVHDTPGVFLPTVKSVEAMLALSLIGSVNSSYIDPVIQADYLLYVLNLQDPSGVKYSDFMKYPTNNVYELLYNIALKRSKLRKDNTYDELCMANYWIELWRQGKGKKFMGLFDVQAILEKDVAELKETHKLEKERIEQMPVHTKITNSLGKDGTSTESHRKRTAKDREFDLRNTFFKL